MFEFTPKVCENQIVTAGRLLTVLDMRPSTASNSHAKVYSFAQCYDHTRLQTNLATSQTSPDSQSPYGPVNRSFLFDRVIIPKLRPEMTRKAIAMVTQEYMYIQ